MQTRTQLQKLERAFIPSLYVSACTREDVEDLSSLKSGNMRSNRL